jgi:hypothetical protein
MNKRGGGPISCEYKNCNYRGDSNQVGEHIIYYHRAYERMKKNSKYYIPISSLK